MSELIEQKLRWDSKEFIKGLEPRLRGDQFEIDIATTDELFAVILGYWLKTIRFRDEGIIERCVERLDLELAAPQFHGNYPEDIQVAEDIDGLENFQYQDLDLPSAANKLAPPYFSKIDLFKVAYDRSQAVDEFLNSSDAYVEAYKYPVGKAMRLEIEEQLLLDIYACSLLEPADEEALVYPESTHNALLKNEHIRTKVGHWDSSRVWIPLPAIAGSSLSSLEFEHTTFTGDSFWEQNFAGKHFYDCTFIKVDFEYANFSNVRFTDCYFIDCQLDGTTFDSASCDAFLVFRNCSLRNTDFTGFKVASNGELQFPNCDLRQATFTGSHLVGAGFDSARLIGANFENAFLDHATFTQASAEKANFTNTSGQVDFILTKLEEANFNSAGLVSASFYKCNLQRATFQEQASCHDASFIDCDLSNAVITEGNFIGALFIGNTLTDSSFELCDFEAGVAIDSDFSRGLLTQCFPESGPRVITIERLG